MQPNDIGNLGAFALVLLLLGKEALKLIATKDKDGGTYIEFKALRETDRRLEHIQDELEKLRAELSQYAFMYQGLESRLRTHEQQLWRAEDRIQSLMRRET